MPHICTCVLIPTFESMASKQRPEKDEKLPKHLFVEKTTPRISKKI